MAKSNKDQVLITYNSTTGLLPSIDGPWQTFSGGATSAGVRKTYDGGSADAILIPSARKDVSNVTIGREFDPVIDGPIFRSARAAVGAERGTLSVQWLDATQVPVGDAEVFTVVLTSATPAEGDVHGNGDMASYSLEFVVGSVA